MRQLSFAEITKASFPDKTCISLYIPSSNHYPNPKESASSLKALIKEVKMISAKSESFPREVFLHKLKSDLPKISILQEQHGVAWFCSESISGWFPVNSVNEPLAVVSDSFHVKPIFQDIQRTKPFYVLTVSLKKVQLFVRKGEGLTRLDWEDVDLASNSLNQPDISAKETKKEKSKVRQIKACMRLINRHLNHLSFPLVIAGTKTIAQQVARKIHYPFTQREIFACDIKKTSLTEIFLATRKISEAFFSAEENRLISEIEDSSKTGHTIYQIEDISKAAVEGRVDFLVLAQDRKLWGEIDWSSGDFSRHKRQKSTKDDDLLDDLIEIVHQYGGQVLLVPSEKLGNRSTIARLRW